MTSRPKRLITSWMSCMAAGPEGRNDPDGKKHGHLRGLSNGSDDEGDYLYIIFYNHMISHLLNCSISNVSLIQ